MCRRAVADEASAGVRADRRRQHAIYDGDAIAGRNEIAPTPIADEEKLVEWGPQDGGAGDGVRTNEERALLRWLFCGAVLSQASFGSWHPGHTRRPIFIV